MGKKLFTIFGPLVLALFAIFGVESIKFDVTPKIEQESASALTQPIISGQVIKNKTLDDKKYVPFFGSSELNRIDIFHPSVLAEKYNRPYRPFLLGSAGTQSLTQYLIIASMPTQLKNSKAIFIISPQWFLPDGVEPEYFSHWYSPVQMYAWLESIDQKKSFSDSERYYADRALDFDVVNSKDMLKHILQKIMNNQPLNNQEIQHIEAKYESLYKEDRLFSRLGVNSINEKKIMRKTKSLPDEYNYNQLYDLAGQIGKKYTNNNPYGIQNKFYTTRLRGTIKSMKGKQSSLDYRKSPEYSDLQLVLDQFDKNNTQVLFIIPPVNEKWSSYTGLSQDMLKQTANKIEHQLTAQGFNNVLNLSEDDDVPYFMNDTIHLGWRGWLKCDTSIQPFLESQYEIPHYQIDDYYYSKDWQNFVPEQK